MKTIFAGSIVAAAIVLVAGGCAVTLPGQPGSSTAPSGPTVNSQATPNSSAAETNRPLGKLESSFIFHPTKFPDGNWNPRGSNWDRGGLAVEDAWFTASDGTKLHGWYYPHPRARAVVLYCHGNAGNLSYCGDLIRYLHDHHELSVMVFDYRGYGRSEGAPSEQGILQDGRAARAWLARRADIAERDIVLMGRSLGGAVAVDMAAADGARGLILESTFTSIPDVTRMRLPLVGSLAQTQLNSLAKIGRYHGPLLFSHGDADSVIPYKIGLRLFEAANEPKQLVTLYGADHDHPQSVEYYQALDRFIDSLPPAVVRSP